MVFLVCMNDYEYHSVAGAFSTREAAETYLADLRGFLTGTMDAAIEEHALDLPRAQLPGCWCVFVNAKGRIVDDPEREYTPEKLHGEVTEPQDLRGHDWPHGIVARGYGLTKNEARKNALAAVTPDQHPLTP
jgi:hypothetical protein